MKNLLKTFCKNLLQQNQLILSESVFSKIDLFQTTNFYISSIFYLHCRDDNKQQIKKLILNLINWKILFEFWNSIKSSSNSFKISEKSFKKCDQTIISKTSCKWWSWWWRWRDHFTESSSSDADCWRQTFNWFSDGMTIEIPQSHFHFLFINTFFAFLSSRL